MGKTEVAQELALQLGQKQARQIGVLSADSMQVYAGMDIGTAKLPEEARKVPHFGLDLVDPASAYSAAQYQSYGRNVIEKQAALSSGTPPIVCGGTGLYLRALLDDFDFADFDAETLQEQAELRDKYEALAEELGAQKLHVLLTSKDPRAAKEIHPNNARRTIRALELWEEGQSYADIKQAFKVRNSYYPTIWIGLNCERELLYDRINKRVDTMIEQGLLQEVEGLLQQGYRKALTAQQAIGYKELVPVLEETESLDSAISAIQQASRRYAKRQLSWFRGDERIKWIANDDMTTSQVLEQIFTLIEPYNMVQE